MQARSAQLGGQLCVAAYLLWSGCAFAQTLEEIIVTAQKREQPVQDVSIAISAFPADQLRDLRVEDPADLARFVSNMDIKGTLGGVNPAITVRGVGLNDFNANNNPAVGVYIDEIFLSSAAMLSARMFDVERVEVLKGPQGTLYGRNATGGAINIVSKKPFQEFDGYVTAGVGDYATYELEGAVGGGLSNTVAGRLSFHYDKQGDSFHKNRLTGRDFGSIDTTSLRGQLSFDPTESSSALLSVHYAKTKGANTPFTIFGMLDPNAPVNPDFSVNPCAPALTYHLDNTQCSDVFGILDDSGTYTHNFNPPDAAKYIIDTDVVGGLLKMNWDIGSLTLTSVTGYESQDRVFGDDINSHPLQLSIITHDEAIDQFSQEFRLLSNEGSRARWVAGIFFSRDKFKSANLFESADLFVTNLFWNVDQETTSAAAFGSIDWLLTDKLTLVTGLRYTDEQTDFKGGTTDLNPYDASCIIDPLCGPTGLGALPLTYTKSRFSDDQFSFRVAMEYRPSDTLMVYGSVASGFKSGGFFGDFTFDNSELEPFKSETILSYEIGAKSTWADGMVKLNAAAFYYDYKDIQTLVPGVLVTAFDNAKGADVFGIDLEFVAAPLDGLTLGLGLGWLDSELGVIGVVPSGNQLPNAPQVQANGLARYEFPVSDALRVGLQASFKYTDKMYRDAFNDPFNTTAAYTLVDGRLSLLRADGKWEAALWGKNLAGEKYVEQAFNFIDITGIAARLYGSPRTWGAQFSYFLGP